MDEVINLMVAYSLGRTRSTNVNREYISKLANDFAFKNIVTAEQGLLALRSGYDKKSQQAKKADSKKKTNVPSWSNPDYDNQTSQADQAKLDEIRRRALAKTRKRKGVAYGKSWTNPKPSRASWVWQCNRFNEANFGRSKSG